MAEITSADRRLSAHHSTQLHKIPGGKSGTSPSDLFVQLKAKWQQRPETPVLISRIHTSSSHHAPHQCSDSAEEWVRPGSNHPLQHRTAAPATPVDASSPTTQTPPKGWADLPDRSTASPERCIRSDSRDSRLPRQLGDGDGPLWRGPLVRGPSERTQQSNLGASSPGRLPTALEQRRA